MAKKSSRSHRSSSRKMKHTRKHRSRRHHRGTHRRGGSEPVNGASVNYHLSGSWPSRMSLGQGADFFKYHEGQHGGVSLGMGPFPAAVLSPGLPPALRGSAHLDGIDKAINDVKGLCDPPACSGNQTTTGGKRRRHRKSMRKSSGKHRKHRTHRRRGGSRRDIDPHGSQQMNINVTPTNTTPHSTASSKGGRRRRGGMLGYAPFPSSGMLLHSQKQYAEAGLNPEWKTDVAFTDAKIRDTQ